MLLQFILYNIKKSSISTIKLTKFNMFNEMLNMLWRCWMMICVVINDYILASLDKNEFNISDM